MISFFDAGMKEIELGEGEMLIQVLTKNNMADNLFAIVYEEDVLGEDFVDDIKFAMRRKYGRLGSNMYRGWEDVTDVYCGEDD